MGTCSGACDVEDGDLLLAKPVADGFDVRVGLKIDSVVGTLVLLGHLECIGGAAAHLANMENQCCVRVDDVLFRADGIVGCVAFGELIAIRDRTGFGTSAFGAPAAVRDAEKDGCVERCLIDSGLSARNDSGKSWNGSGVGVNSTSHANMIRNSRKVHYVARWFLTENRQPFWH